MSDIEERLILEDITQKGKGYIHSKFFYVIFPKQKQQTPALLTAHNLVVYCCRATLRTIPHRDIEEVFRRVVWRSEGASEQGWDGVLCEQTFEKHLLKTFS